MKWIVFSNVQIFRGWWYHAHIYSYISVMSWRRTINKRQNKEWSKNRGECSYIKFVKNTYHSRNACEWLCIRTVIALNRWICFFLFVCLLPWRLLAPSKFVWVYWRCLTENAYYLANNNWYEFMGVRFNKYRETLNKTKIKAVWFLFLW